MKIQLQYSDTIEIDVSSIKSIDINPRTSIDQQSILELADTIKKVGLLQPIVVYKEDDEYHLIFGKRRLLAVKQNKDKKINARLLTNELTNEVRQLIKDIQLIENGQRKDVHPLEEAYAFSQSQHSTIELSARIGKSITYVQGRLNLLNLCDEVREYFYSNILTVSHALLLCQLTEQYQKIVLANILKFNGKGEDKVAIGVLSIAQTRNNISRVATVNLSCAKFDLKDKSINSGAGSCLKCPKRSGYNRNLFNDIEDDDICFDKSCFDVKSFNYALIIEQELREKGFNTIRLTAYYDNSKKELDEKQLEPDYLFYRNDIELKQENLIGIYFEHHNKTQIGQHYTIFPRTNEVQETISQNTKQRKVSNIEAIKKDKAQKAVSNALLLSLGLKLGAYHCDNIPIPMLRLLSYNYYTELSEEIRINVDKFYEYENNNNITAAFNNITKFMSYQNLTQFLLVCMIYSHVKNLDNKEMRFIKELCAEWKIDIAPIIEKVEKEFSITIELAR